MRAIETDRLILRNFIPSDAEAIHQLFCDSEAMRLTAMYPPYTEMSQTEDRVLRWAKYDCRVAVALKDSGICIGYISISLHVEGGRELGFGLNSAYRGKRYMSEAVKAMINELKSEGVCSVWACCFRENKASEALIRSLGFELVNESTFDSPNDRTYESLEFRMELTESPQSYL